MDEAEGVHRIDPRARVDQDAHQIAQLKPGLPRQTIGKRPSRDVALRQVRDTVGVADLDEFDHTGVLHARGGAGLARKAPPEHVIRREILAR